MAYFKAKLKGDGDEVCSVDRNIAFRTTNNYSTAIIQRTYGEYKPQWNI